ncbi:MAG: hypothetical protein R2829_05460 [Bacteroidia bacterium]
MEISLSHLNNDVCCHSFIGRGELRAMTLEKLTTQQKEHYFAPLTHSSYTADALQIRCVLSPLQG